MFQQYVRAPDGKLHIAGESIDGILSGERACGDEDLGQVVIHHMHVVLRDRVWTCKDCGFTTSVTLG